MAVKVYISLKGQLHFTSIQVEGKSKRIQFSGAEGDSNGTYTTGKESEQKAIESSPLFGKHYKLLKAYKDTTEKKGIVGPGTIVNGPVSSEVYKDAGLVEGEKTEVVSPVIEEIPEALPEGRSPKSLVFRTTNEAQEFLGKGPYNVPKSKLRTYADIIAKGAELGLSISFSKE